MQLKELRNYIDLPDGTTKGKTTLYTYNTIGWVINEVYPEDQNLPTFANSYNYPEMDTKGNWIVMNEFIEYMGSKNGPRKTTRIIEYY